MESPHGYSSLLAVTLQNNTKCIEENINIIAIKLVLSYGYYQTSCGGYRISSRGWRLFFSYI